MRLDKFTQKAQEAILEAQTLAEGHNHAQIEPEHLLLALLQQADGVAPQIVQGLGRNPGQLAAQVEAELHRRPKVYGGAAQVGIGQAAQRVLQAAQAEADAMKDDYVSTEHLLLALAGKEGNGASRLLTAAGVTKDAILQALQAIRGSQRVTSQNPETTYQALQKYGRDLTDLARKGKLDPVIGRDEEIRRVIQILSRRTKNNPVLIGEPGVGKTELARALAEFLFDDEQAMVRIDMSEYQERHTVSRLVGAPPGYVGYEEGGQLTEAVRRKPYSVVLFDEIEKAHPEVFNTLLQVLDDGRLTDGHGRTVDFKNTVVIMTSNVGSETWHVAGGRSEVAGGRSQVADEADAREQEARRYVMEALRATFRPEFLNRIDEIVVFHPLSREHLGQIVEIQLGRLHGLLASRKITLELSAAARALLAERGYDPVYGARPLKRAIQQLVQDPLALALLRGDFAEGDSVVADVRGDQIVFHS